MENFCGARSSAYFSPKLKMDYLMIMGGVIINLVEHRLDKEVLFPYVIALTIATIILLIILQLHLWNKTQEKCIKL